MYFPASVSIQKGTATGPLQSEFRDSATPSAPLVENWPATTGRTVGRSESGAGKPKLVKELEHHLRDEMRKTESAGEARSSDVGRLQVRHYPTGFFKKMNAKPMNRMPPSVSVAGGTRGGGGWAGYFQ